MVRGTEQCAFYVQYISDPADMSQGPFREFACDILVAGVQLARVIVRCSNSREPNYITDAYGSCTVI